MNAIAKSCYSLPLIAFMFLASCSSAPIPKAPVESTEDEVGPSLKPPSNVVKVLNNVLCAGCNQEMINALWQACLDQGYVQSPPSQRVIASRDLSELVSTNYTYSDTEYYNVPYTDHNGIVTETKQSREIPRSMKLEGQCRGSEYIL
jgi:hypothetical protein